jgi:hypothetical protein
MTDIPSPPEPSARIALLARRGARVLEVAAGVLAVGIVFSSWTLTYTDPNAGGNFGGTSLKLPGNYKFAQFLQNCATSLAWILLVLAAGFALEIVALRATRSPERAHDPFAPDRAVQADDTSPVIQRAGGAAVPTIVPRRDAPITVDTVSTGDDTVWRR